MTFKKKIIQLKIYFFNTFLTNMFLSHILIMNISIRRITVFSKRSEGGENKIEKEYTLLKSSSPFTLDKQKQW